MEGVSSTPGRLAAAARPVCPEFHEAVELIGRRWTGAILFALGDGPLRFGELSESVTGVSDRLLSRRLKELEDRDIVARSVSPGTPVRVDYSLTDKGKALRPAIVELRDWARRWNDDGRVSRSS